MAKKFRITFIDSERKRQYVSDREGLNATPYPSNAYIYQTLQKAEAICRKLYKYGPHVQEIRSVNFGLE